MLRQGTKRQASLAHRIRSRHMRLVWVMLGLSQSACSILAPTPAWELVKATGSVASIAVMSRPGEARNTVYHEHQLFNDLCIEFNPQTQVADIVPALQTALRKHQIESRVYESTASAQKCNVWLKYSAFIDWGTPPFSDQYKPYVSTAALTLQTTQGQVLSSSHYELDGTFGASKWASTRDKLTPVVTALITGFTN